FARSNGKSRTIYPRKRKWPKITLPRSDRCCSKMETRRWTCREFAFTKMRKRFRPHCKDAWIKRGTPLLKNVIRIFSKINDFQQMYEQVKRWTLPIRHAADILEPEM